MRDVAEWLDGLGLGTYAELFQQNAIDLRALPHVTDEDLIALAVPLGHRRIILAAAADLGMRSPASGDAERRQLTVLFCDLVGSTALSSRLDPEDMRDVIRAYQDACARVVARYDGFVAKYMGDGVLVYFGYPVAHEDDAERAINVGLDIVDAIAALEGDLQVRIGIATGTVAVGDIVGEGASEEAAIVGDAPNLASRLQELAEPGSVVISEATQVLAAGLFQLTDLGRRAVKGFADPVNTWVVVGRHRTESRFTAIRGERLTEFVGRKEEIDELLRRWERAKTGHGQVILVSGEPGIGKSRLIQEFRHRVSGSPHLPLNYQCSPYHTNSALYPVIERLTDAVGFDSSDDANARVDKLEAMLAPSGQPMDRIVPLFAGLLSVSTEGRYPPLQVPPPVRKELTLKALTGRIAAMAARRPVLLSFEDVHWIDPTTLEFLGLVVDQAPDIPLLALITFRPEFEAPWSDRPDIAAVVLGRLARGEIATMVHSIEGGRELLDDLQGRIVDQSDGVPLFVEELTKSVVEVASDRLAVIEVPATLKDSLEARLDRLGPAKEVAQLGAVVGRSFDYPLISAIAGIGDSAIGASLDQLLRSGLATSRGDPPETVYTFKHALIQDTAYGTLLRSKRAEIHAQIAETIESLFPERAEAEPEVLAHHFSNAGNFQTGAKYWSKAGQIALQRSSFQEAVAQLGNGMRLVERLPNESERFGLETEIRAVLAPAIRAYKGLGHPETEQAFKLAYELCRQDPNSIHTFPLLWGLWHIGFSQGHMGPAAEYADDLLGLAEQSRDTERMLIANCSVGMISFFTAKNHRAIDHVEQSLALHDPSAHAALAFSYFFEFGVFGHIILAMTRFSVGLPDQALQAVDRAVEIARSINQPHSHQFALSTRGLILALRGDGAAALRNAEKNLALAVAPAAGLVNEICHGWGTARVGQWDEGIRQMSQSIHRWKQIGSEYMLPLFGVLLADSCIACGRLDEAYSIADDELSRIASGGQEQWRSPILSIKAETLVLRGISDEVKAEDLYLQAIEIAQTQSAKSWELRAAIRLARLWRSQGRTSEARNLLAPVYNWFTEGFDMADLVEAKVLLDDLS